MIFIILSLLILLISSCSFFTRPYDGIYQYTNREFSSQSVRIIPIWIDGNFGQADLLSITKAIEQWNYALNGQIILRVVDLQFNMETSKIVEQVQENGWLIMKVNSTAKFIPLMGGGYNCIGFAERLGGNHIYLVRDRLWNSEVEGVTMHEIGHLLGSPHVGDRLMSPHYNKARWQCIDYATMEQVAKYQRLPLDKLNYCMDPTEN